MKLEFNRKPKTKMVGIRLTESEFYHVKAIAQKNDVSMAEASEVLLRAALEEYKANMTTKA